ncbi:MAG: hypothetical protein LBR39_00120 [Coriobacteriales bacterium]|jgi:shikimate 5-dehydrogenase|nr:hypothetical protein [Coriobacteriales bacterium]
MYKTGLATSQAENSIIPTLHNAAYQESGLDWRYEVYPCNDASDFAALIQTAKREGSGFVGLDVSDSFIKDANRLALSRSQDAALLKAADVLTFNAGSMRSFAGAFADNAFGQAAISVLQRVGQGLSAKSVVVYGDGPRSAAIILELARAGIASLTIVSADCRAAEAQARMLFQGLARQRIELVSRSMIAANRNALVQWNNSMGELIKQEAPQIALSTVGYEQASEALARADVLISTVSWENGGADLADLAGSLAAETPSGMIVLDVCPNQAHEPSQVLSRAAVWPAGAVVLDNLELSIEQAALSIGIWASALGFDTADPRPAMRTAVGL